MYEDEISSKKNSKLNLLPNKNKNNDFSDLLNDQYNVLNKNNKLISLIPGLSTCNHCFSKKKGIIKEEPEISYYATKSYKPTNSVNHKELSLEETISDEFAKNQTILRELSQGPRRSFRLSVNKGGAIKNVNNRNGSCQTLIEHGRHSKKSNIFSKIRKNFRKKSDDGDSEYNNNFENNNNCNDSEIRDLKDISFDFYHFNIRKSSMEFMKHLRNSKSIYKMTKPKTSVGVLNKNYNSLIMSRVRSKILHNFIEQKKKLKKLKEDRINFEVDRSVCFYNFISDFKHNKTQSRYSYIKDISDGVFGTLVECYDRKKNGLIVIVKLMKKEMKCGNKTPSEIKILFKMMKNDGSNNNPCIKMIKWFELQNRACIIFRRHGDTLATFLKMNQEGLPISSVTIIAFQLSLALHFLHHKCGIIHTNINPHSIAFSSSVYVTSSLKRGTTIQDSVKFAPSRFDVKLIDFQHALDAFPDDSMKSGLLFNPQDWDGTFYKHKCNLRPYRAPEILLESEWSYQVDLWALGCTLFEILTGTLLFNQKNNLNQLAAIDKVVGPIVFSEFSISDRYKFFHETGFFDSELYFSGLSYSWIVQRSQILGHTSESLYYLIKTLVQPNPSQRSNSIDILSFSLFENIPEVYKRRYLF